MKPFSAATLPPTRALPSAHTHPSMHIQVEKTLMLEQRHAEFLMRVEDVGGDSFTRPTNACMLVCR